MIVSLRAGAGREFFEGVKWILSHESPDERASLRLLEAPHGAGGVSSLFYTPRPL